jgi:hypothetical protein
MLSATRKYEQLQSLTGEQPHGFVFPVTWNSLTASLALDEAPVATSKSPLEIHLESELLELVAAPHVASPPRTEPPPPGANGRWEMVVPQMVRTRNKTFEPVADSPRSVAPPSDPRLLPPPLFSSFQPQSLFSRAVSLFGRRPQRLLESAAPPEPPPPSRPTVSPAEMEARRAARELLLSKIARSMRGRGDER